MNEDDYFSFVRASCADEESFQQEYCCVPSDDNTAFFPYDLITGCEYKANEAWQTNLVDCKNPFFVGVDIGREHDLTGHLADRTDQRHQFHSPCYRNVQADV